MLAPIGLQQDHLVCSMRCQNRQRLAIVRDRLGFCARDFVGRHDTGQRSPVEHTIACGACSSRETIGPAQFRRLRQGDQQRRLGQRQLTRLLAEIGERRRANALEISAIGCKRQIKRKDPVFAERAFEFERAHDLAQFGAQTTPLAWLQKTRHLHADRRAARDDMAPGHELNRSTSQSEIDRRLDDR